MIPTLLQIEPAGGLSEALSSSPLLALAAMFGAGVLTSLTPCVYPMIPITSATDGGSYGAVFFMGAMSGVVAAPCGAPAFAVVLTWVAATQAGLMGFVYLFVFSLGMTSLLIVVGLFSGTLTLLPRSGAWMVWVKRIAAVIMIAMAEYYFMTAGYNL